MLENIISYRLCCEKSFSLLADVSVDAYEKQLHAIVYHQTQKKKLLVEAGLDDDPVEALPQPSVEDSYSSLSIGQQLRHTWFPVGGELNSSLTILFDHPSRLLTECFPLLDLKPYVRRVLLRRDNPTKCEVVLICHNYEHLGLTRSLLQAISHTLFDFMCAQAADNLKPSQCQLQLEILILDDDNDANRRWLNEFCQGVSNGQNLNVQGSIIDASSGSVYLTNKRQWLKRRYYRQLLSQSDDSLESIMQRCQRYIY